MSPLQHGPKHGFGFPHFAFVLPAARCVSSFSPGSPCIFGHLFIQGVHLIVSSYLRRLEANSYVNIYCTHIYPSLFWGTLSQACPTFDSSNWFGSPPARARRKRSSVCGCRESFCSSQASGLHKPLRLRPGHSKRKWPAFSNHPFPGM